MTNIEKLLRVLGDYLWHSSDELADKVSHRFGDTIHKARNKGYVIETRAINHTHKHEYRMLENQHIR